MEAAMRENRFQNGGVFYSDVDFSSICGKVEKKENSEVFSTINYYNLKGKMSFLKMNWGLLLCRPFVFALTCLSRNTLLIPWWSPRYFWRVLEFIEFSKWFGGNKGGLTVKSSRADFALSIAMFLNMSDFHSFTNKIGPLQSVQAILHQWHSICLFPYIPAL